MNNISSFNDFVSHTKESLKSDKFKWLVLGNESSDLDSVVCALVYSYYKQFKLGESYSVIPVICIPKLNIILKQDVVMWLKNFNIDIKTDLTYLEDIVMLLSNEKFCNNLKISLVDHHKPIDNLITKFVIEIIDHRELSYEYDLGQLKLNNIKLVGSCSTLIASYILAENDLLCKCILLKFLYGVILVDTDCLLIKNGRTTKFDIDVVEEIEKIVMMNKENRNEIYKMLFMAKCDMSGLTLNQLMKRDLKIIEVPWNHSNVKIAIPTLIDKDVQEILSLNDLEKSLLEILKDLNVSTLISLVCNNKASQRGYIIYSENLKFQDKICQFLLSEEKLKLKQINSNYQSSIVAFVEDHLLTSRKIFIPMIEKFFSQESNKGSIFECQSNNCNILLQFDETNTSDIDELENEGAPYTLSTPRCSYSGSPDMRNSEMNLPSFNNRRTLALIDQKRQKHIAYLDVTDNDENLDHCNKEIAANQSLLAYTPENSGDEDNDYKCDHNTFQSLNNKSVDNVEKKEYHTFLDKKRETNISGSGLTCQLDKDISEAETSKFKLPKDDWDKNINYLISEVDKKRQQLETNHSNSIANLTMKDVIRKSQTLYENEAFCKEVLNMWSGSYSQEELKEFIKFIYNNDTLKLANLLTTGIIRDSLSEFKYLSVKSDTESSGNNIVAVDIDDNSSGGSYDDDDGEKKKIIPSTEFITDSDSEKTSSSLPDSTIPDLEINYNSCPIGTIINKDTTGVSPCLDSSGLDVENSSFNLYRRISSNQLDFSEDEKRLFAIAGNWCPDDNVIYSDSEQEYNSAISNEDDIDVMTNIIFPNKQITMSMNK